MKSLDLQIIGRCQNVLSQHAAWLSLPGMGDTYDVAASVADVAELLGVMGKCCGRTYPPLDFPGSQGNEDSILEQLLPPPMMGAYVDVGAGEPKQCSNTWKFYNRGWRGLLIEPLPAFIQQLTRWRPGDCVFPVAASDYSGMMPFYVDGIVSSSLADWSISAPTRPQAVECMTMADILSVSDFQHIGDECSLCSIDVEGHERQVLSGIPWDTFRPKVFCVEYRKYETKCEGKDLSGEWEPILLTNGYRLHATTLLNKIYVLDTIPTEEASSITAQQS